RSPAGAARLVVLPVGHPDVAVPVDVDAVREDHHPRAEALDQRAAAVELQDRIQRRAETGVRAAALTDPDRLAVLVDVDGAGRSPGPSLRQLEVVLDRFERVR